MMSQGLRQFAQDAGSFALAAGVRAIKTMCQTAVALIGTGAVGIADVDWRVVASGTALSGVLSILTSVATGLPELPQAALPEAPEE